MFTLPTQLSSSLASTNTAFITATTTIASILTASVQMPALRTGIMETLAKAATTASSEAEVISPLGILLGAISSTLVGAFIIQKTTDIKLFPSDFSDLNFFSKSSPQNNAFNYQNNLQKILYKLSLARPILDKNIIIAQVALLTCNQENSENTRIFFGLSPEQFQKFTLDLNEYMNDLSESAEPEIYEYHLNQFYSFYLNEFSKRGICSSSSEIKNNVYNL